MPTSFPSNYVFHRRLPSDAPDIRGALYPLARDQGFVHDHHAHGYRGVRLGWNDSRDRAGLAHVRYGLNFPRYWQCAVDASELSSTAAVTNTFQASVAAPGLDFCQVCWFQALIDDHGCGYGYEVVDLAVEEVPSHRFERRFEQDVPEVIAPEDLWQTKVGALQDSCDHACLRGHLLADYSHARGVRLDEEIERENYAPVYRFEERATAAPAHFHRGALIRQIEMIPGHDLVLVGQESRANGRDGQDQRAGDHAAPVVHEALWALAGP
ncbi:hypothetical protein HG530_005381 [Fusarium avenaceum]|nr:hypothetical protein HG530_005381 [Fusarium avenaceum]